jgi:hypothetical protein
MMDKLAAMGDLNEMVTRKRTMSELDISNAATERRLAADDAHNAALGSSLGGARPLLTPGGGLDPELSGEQLEDALESLVGEEESNVFVKTLVSDVSDKEAYKLLQNVKRVNSAFKTFTDEELQLLSKLLSVLKVSEGDKVISKGEVATFVSSGYREPVVLLQRVLFVVVVVSGFSCYSPRFSLLTCTQQSHLCCCCSCCCVRLASCCSPSFVDVQHTAASSRTLHITSKHRSHPGRRVRGGDQRHVPREVEGRRGGG